jgi:N-acyl-L-homoserine lactone synthetase
MARPKKPAHERRTESMRFSVTDFERAQIEHAASAHGLGLSEFFRRRALGVRLPAAAVVSQQEAEATTALLRLGVNLNQIAKHVNAGRGTPVAELSDIIARINSAMDALYESGRNRPR